MSEHNKKSTKISLEPRLDHAAFDVKEGVAQIETEIYEIKQTPAQKLSQQILRIWNELDLKSLSIEALDEPNHEIKTKLEPKNHDVEIPNQEIEPGNKDDQIRIMRETAHRSLYASLNEIRIGIEVVNLVNPDQRKGTIVEQSIPSGTIEHIYHNPSEPTKQTQVQNFKLMLASKRKQLKHAAMILMSKGEKYGQMIGKERAFWREALSLRQNNWSIIGYGQKAGHTGKQLFVDYGYNDAGSLFDQNTMAQIQRTPNDKQIAISFPPVRKKLLRLRLERRISGPERHQDIAEINSSIDSKMISGQDMHHQLLAAQSAVFELELFLQILKEAASLLGVKMIENEILIPVYEDVDLTIQWIDADDSIEKEISSKADDVASPEVSSTCKTLKLAMNLILRRYHRRNIEKVQKKVLGKISRHERSTPQGHIFILPLHLLRYHFFCNRIREVSNYTIKPLRDAGVSVQMHFMNTLAEGNDMIDLILNAETIDAEDPLFTGMITITIDQIHSLRVTLESPCTAIIHLTHSELRTEDLHHFYMFLERELRFLLLKIIYKEIEALSILEESGWEGNWILDRFMLVIVRASPTVMHLVTKKTSQQKMARRPAEVTIQTENSTGKMTISVRSLDFQSEFGLSSISQELVIGDVSTSVPKPNSRQDFTDRVRQFLISLT
ncbi:hypothetical protein G9A89_005103 [Geosiphon pyriformis]|nr:hypothetical protein G9A89_005103 [Geosiphon pyriformis]